MSEVWHEQDGNLRVALSTWFFLLHQAGFALDDAEITEACAAVGAASGPDEGEEAGQRLIERVRSLVDSAGPTPGLTVARRVVGSGLSTEMGAGDRDDRLHRIRAYQFQRGLPWLARLWERRSDGTVAPSWLLVSRVTDQVRVMDPNPWNDIDEDREIPVHDFLVLWELDDCTSFSMA